MNVFGLMNNHLTGCEYYRVMQPLQALRSLGHNTAYMTAEKALKEMARTNSPPWLPADIILVNRLMTPKELIPDILALFDGMRRMNPALRIIYDSDDDLTNRHLEVHPENMDFPDLRVFDRITVTTPYLREVMKRFNPRVTVIPNFIQVENFMNQMRLTASDRVTIGLSGSSWHRGDWQAVIQPLNRILMEFGDKVQVFVSGFEPVGLLNYITPIDLKMGDDVALPFVQYPAVWAQCDIAVIPLDPNNRFNFSKSWIKAGECSASARMVDETHVGGVVPIAVSNPPIYNSFIHHTHNGLLVSHHDPDSWYRAIKRLIVDEKLRKQMQVNAFAEVLKWDIVRRIKEVESVYLNVIKTPNAFQVMA